MTRRQLGRSGVAISPMVLGGNVFGWTADKARSFDVLDRFTGAGLEAIDTADVYSRWVPGNQGGESETIIGEWIASRKARDRIVLITKVGYEMDRGGLSAAHIERAVEDSLTRLQTDRIDVYFSHKPDPATGHEETLRAYERLIQAGKVRTIGASNFDAGQLRAALDAAAANGLPRYEVIQPAYNLYDRREFEGALRDLVMAQDIGVISYYGLAKGFLSGKYRSDVDLGQSPRGSGISAYMNARGFQILAALDEIAARHEAKPAEVALAWVMAQPGLTAPIASATSIPQVDSLIRATELALSADDLAALEAASSTSA
jgi:aryl-alcohol dehydrogenase-like predicted oxidoreductase